MNRRRGPLARLLATVSDQALRVVGAAMICLSAAVTAGSLTTEHGIETPATEAATATTAVSATVLIEFAAAHPAYPLAMLVGLVLLATNDDAPLIGS